MRYLFRFDRRALLYLDQIRGLGLAGYECIMNPWLYRRMWDEYQDRPLAMSNERILHFNINPFYDISSSLNRSVGSND